MTTFATFIRRNSLTLAFFTLFLLALIGQSLTGLAEFNNRQLAAGVEAVSYLQYITSSAFAVDVAENWQSEYLQFFLFIMATVWLVQVGSPESKKPEQAGTESDEEQKLGRYATKDSPAWARTERAARTRLYGNSLGLVMLLLFLLSWLAQAITGTVAYNADQIQQLQDPVSGWGYVTTSDFWNRTLQNWQSEFLAVASMAAFSIYLRQRGSPESKPVGAPHSATGVDG